MVVARALIAGALLSSEDAPARLPEAKEPAVTTPQARQPNLAAAPKTPTPPKSQPSDRDLASEHRAGDDAQEPEQRFPQWTSVPWIQGREPADRDPMALPVITFDDRPESSLAPVFGVVVDAKSGDPVEAASLSWEHRVPHRAERWTVATTTGPDGRFELERPKDHESVQSRFHVWSEGYGCLEVHAGLGREDVRVVLPQPATLILVLEGQRPPDSDEAPTLWEANGAEAPTGHTSTAAGNLKAWTFSGLTPGRYWVQFANVRLFEVELRAGERLERPFNVSGHQWRGRLVSADGQPEGNGGRLVLVETKTFTRLAVDLREDGRTEWSLFIGPGRYVAFFEPSEADQYDREVRLPGEIQGGGEQVFRSPPLGSLVKVQAPAGELEFEQRLALLGLDPFSHWIPLDPTEEEDLYSAPNVPEGRYALLRYTMGATTVLSELSVPLATPLAADTATRSFHVRWQVPAGLWVSEAVRGELRVRPEVLARLRPDLFANDFWPNRWVHRLGPTGTEPFDTFSAPLQEHPLELLIIGQGRHLLLGRTDLGTFKTELDLDGPHQLLIDLSDR